MTNSARPNSNKKPASWLQSALWQLALPGLVVLMSAAECEADVLWLEGRIPLSILCWVVALSVVFSVAYRALYFFDKYTLNKSISRWAVNPSWISSLVLLFLFCGWRSSGGLERPRAAHQSWKYGWEYRLRERYLLPRAVSIFGDELGNAVYWNRRPVEVRAETRNIAYGGEKSDVIAETDSLPLAVAVGRTGEAGTFLVDSSYPSGKKLAYKVLRVREGPLSAGWGSSITIDPHNESPGTFFAGDLEVPESLGEPVVVSGTLSVPVIYAKLDAPGSYKYYNTTGTATGRCEVLLVPKSYSGRVHRFFDDDEGLSLGVSLGTFFGVILPIAGISVMHLVRTEKKREHREA
jgi:hypothetical protein